MPLTNNPLLQPMSSSAGPSTSALRRPAGPSTSALRNPAGPSPSAPQPAPVSSAVPAILGSSTQMTAAERDEDDLVSFHLTREMNRWLEHARAGNQIPTSGPEVEDIIKRAAAVQALQFLANKSMIIQVRRAQNQGPTFKEAECQTSDEIEHHGVQSDPIEIVDPQALFAARLDPLNPFAPVREDEVNGSEYGPVPQVRAVAVEEPGSSNLNGRRSRSAPNNLRKVPAVRKDQEVVAQKRATRRGTRSTESRLAAQPELQGSQNATVTISGDGPVAEPMDESNRAPEAPDATLEAQEVVDEQMNLAADPVDTLSAQSSSAHVFSHGPAQQDRHVDEEPDTPGQSERVVKKRKKMTRPRWTAVRRNARDASKRQPNRSRGSNVAQRQARSTGSNVAQPALHDSMDLTQAPQDAAGIIPVEQPVVEPIDEPQRAPEAPVNPRRRAVARNEAPRRRVARSTGSNVAQPALHDSSDLTLVPQDAVGVIPVEQPVVEPIDEPRQAPEAPVNARRSAVRRNEAPRRRAARSTGPNVAQRRARSTGSNVAQPVLDDSSDRTLAPQAPQDAARIPGDGSVVEPIDETRRAQEAPVNTRRAAVRRNEAPRRRGARSTGSNVAQRRARSTGSNVVQPALHDDAMDLTQAPQDAAEVIPVEQPVVEPIDEPRRAPEASVKRRRSAVARNEAPRRRGTRSTGSNVAQPALHDSSNLTLAPQNSAGVIPVEQPVVEQTDEPRQAPEATVNPRRSDVARNEAPSRQGQTPSRPRQSPDQLDRLSPEFNEGGELINDLDMDQLAQPELQDPQDAAGINTGAGSVVEPMDESNRALDAPVAALHDSEAQEVEDQEMIPAADPVDSFTSSSAPILAHDPIVQQNKNEGDMEGQSNGVATEIPENGQFVNESEAANEPESDGKAKSNSDFPEALAPPQNKLTTAPLAEFVEGIIVPGQSTTDVPALEVPVEQASNEDTSVAPQESNNQDIEHGQAPSEPSVDSDALIEQLPSSASNEDTSIAPQPKMAPQESNDQDIEHGKIPSESTAASDALIEQLPSSALSDDTTMAPQESNDQDIEHGQALSEPPADLDAFIEPLPSSASSDDRTMAPQESNDEDIEHGQAPSESPADFDALIEQLPSSASSDDRTIAPQESDDQDIEHGQAQPESSAASGDPSEPLPSSAPQDPTISTDRLGSANQAVESIYDQSELSADLGAPKEPLPASQDQSTAGSSSSTQEAPIARRKRNVAWKTDESPERKPRRDHREARDQDQAASDTSATPLTEQSASSGEPTSSNAGEDTLPDAASDNQVAVVQKGRRQAGTPAKKRAASRNGGRSAPKKRRNRYEETDEEEPDSDEEQFYNYGQKEKKMYSDKFVKMSREWVTLRKLMHARDSERIAAKNYSDEQKQKVDRYIEKLSANEDKVFPTMPVTLSTTYPDDGDYRYCTSFLESLTMLTAELPKKDKGSKDVSIPTSVPRLKLTGPLYLDFNCKAEDVIKAGAQFMESNVNAISNPGKFSLEAPSDDLFQKEKIAFAKDREGLTGDLRRRMPCPFFEPKSAKELYSKEFEKLVNAAPVSLIGNMGKTVGMNLKLFTIDAIAGLAPDSSIDILHQIPQSVDRNYTNEGSRSWATFGELGTMRMSDFLEHVKAQEESSFKAYEIVAESDDQFEAKLKRLINKQRKNQYVPEGKNDEFPWIRFGTNVDMLKDIYKDQFKEVMKKFPEFFRPKSKNNLLNYCGCIVLGVNTVQIYLKVPGVRTAAHLENSLMASINWNVGPGTSIWLCISYEYWGVMEKMCQEKGQNFNSQNYWPDEELLIQRSIPYYKFEQKRDECVYLNTGTIHWVQSQGFCVNVSWNVGQPSFTQLATSIVSYDHNLANAHQQHVPLAAVSWNLAKNKKFLSDEKMYKLLRSVMIRSMGHSKWCFDFVEHYGLPLRQVDWPEDERIYRCNKCLCELFNVIKWFKNDSEEVDSHPYCGTCPVTEDMKKDRTLEYTYYYSMQELKEIFDSYVPHH